MDLDSTARVFSRPVSEEYLGDVIPGFAHCPDEYDRWDWQLATVFADEASVLMENLVS
jgi:hypothetical protein